MNLITNALQTGASWAWDTITSTTFSETGRSIRKIGGGLFLLGTGSQIASHSWHHPAYHATPWRSRATVLLGAGMCAVGAYLAMSGITELVFPKIEPSTPPSSTSPFTCRPYPPLPPHEEEMRQRFGESSLCFNATDPREKVLYLNTQQYRTPLSRDPTYPRFHDENLADLNTRFDIKYKSVFSPDQHCQEIQEASRSDRLAGVIIHGDSLSPVFTHGRYGVVNERLTKREFQSPCFQGSPQAKVVLYPFVNDTFDSSFFSQWLADDFQRTTYSPRASTNGLSILPHFEPCFDRDNPHYINISHPRPFQNQYDLSLSLLDNVADATTIATTIFSIGVVGLAGMNVLGNLLGMLANTVPRALKKAANFLTSSPI